MKIGSILNFLNELSKRYSFNFLACFGYLTIIELILYFSLAPLIYRDLESLEIFIFTLSLFLPTIFLFLFIMKVIISVKLWIKERRDANFIIKSKFLKTNILYKLFIYLSFIFSSVVIYYIVLLTTWSIIDKEELYLHLTHFYPIMFILISLYLLITKKYSSIKTDICFYIMYLLLSFILVVLMILRMIVF